jgi:glycosyltransferase involved in cell wall biosynthesis
MPRLDLHVESILGYRRPFHCSPIGFNKGDYPDDVINRQNPMSAKFPKNKVIIGYAGSMGITNALEPFIECIEKLKNNDRIHFMLVGSGDLKSRFENQLNNCQNVTFLSRLQQHEVKYFLSNCDILYLSTQRSNVWRYGQSMNKVVEYMLSAKPIIASYSGFPSMLNESGSGVFISSHDSDSIKSAILDFARLTPAQLAEIGSRGRKWIYENRLYSKLAQDYLHEIVKVKNS